MTCHSVGQVVTNTQQLGTPDLSPPNGEVTSIDSRRLLGSYYTPDKLATILAEWALQPGEGTVLDPSFGGCAFLNAATKVLSDRGVPDPGRLVFGVDVDPSCLKYVRGNGNLTEKNCIFNDFLMLSPKEVPGTPFKAVIGNPPYLRHHWFNGTSREAGRAAICNAGIKLPETASAWAYFLIHALSFLAEGGRLAMLVPEAILQADYAASVRDFLVSRFDKTFLVYIHDRLFEGTDEAVVAVIASGHGKQGSLRVEAVERTEDLAAILNAPAAVRSTIHLTTDRGRCTDSGTVHLLSELEQHAAVRKVSELAAVRIGLVTGANKHFIRNVENLRQLGIPREAWVRLVSRTRWLLGLDFTREDLQKLIDSGERAILVRPMSAHEDNPGVGQWIIEGIEGGIHKRYKCTIRDPWFRVALQPVPDAFATCTRMGAPLLVLNRAGGRCTNALHALSWNRGVDVSATAIAVGFLTSAVGVWSELYGRRYGGGVLKIEPGTLNRTPVPVVRRVECAFDELNKLIRCGREDDARALADDLVLGDELGLSKNDIRRLQRAGRQLMIRRSPVRKGNGRG